MSLLKFKLSNLSASRSTTAGTSKNKYAPSSKSIKQSRRCLQQTKIETEESPTSDARFSSEIQCSPMDPTMSKFHMTSNSTLTASTRTCVTNETSFEDHELQRQELRLNGFEPYVLVALLQAQASFEVMMSTTKSTSELDWHFHGIFVFAGISTLAGIYTTVVFSLTVLYGKTAMGLNRDEAYYDFLDQTSQQRHRAFAAFTYGLFSFLSSVLLELCHKCPETLRFACVMLSFIILFFAKSEYDSFMAAAAPMFMPKRQTSDDVIGSKNERLHID